MMKKLFNSVFDYLCAIGDTLYEYRQLENRHYY
jgi:hypothetical protein